MGKRYFRMFTNSEKVNGSVEEVVLPKMTEKKIPEMTVIEQPIIEEPVVSPIVEENIIEENVEAVPVEEVIRHRGRRKKEVTEETSISPETTEVGE